MIVVLCKYLTKPDGQLKGDYHFIVEKMVLKYPILPIASKDELKIYNNFMANNDPTLKNLERLAEIFKDKSDGITVFPKLPSLLKTYHKTWEKNQGIQTAEDDLGPKPKTLLHRFFFGTNANYITDDITAPANEELNTSTAENEIESLIQNKESTRNEDATNSSSTFRENTAEEAEDLLKSFVPHPQATK